MVAVAVTVTSGRSAPISGTSVGVTWLTVTVTVSTDELIATDQGSQRDGSISRTLRSAQRMVRPRQLLEPPREQRVGRRVDRERSPRAARCRAGRRTATEGTRPTRRQPGHGHGWACVASSQLAGDRIDDPIEEVADLAGPAAAGGPADDEQRDDRGAEHDEGVFGGGLTSIISVEDSRVSAGQ